MTSKSDDKVLNEFGGPCGTLFIIIASHCLMIYLWLSLEFHQGGVFVPDFSQLGQQMQGLIPTAQSVAVYWGFIILQLFLALFMPGPIAKGMPLPSLNGQQLSYRCNALSSWYLTLVLVFVLHATGILPVTFLMDNYGSMLGTAMISGNVVSFIIYFWAILTKQQTRMSGNFIYDFFMGAFLNPRIGPIDLKLFAEIRASWLQLFLLTLSAAVKQYETTGHLSNSMIIMIVAHTLYANATAKGQQCVVTTWDIFYEKFGWMLIFWNICGVPYLYSFHSVYLLRNSWIDLSVIEFSILLVVLLAAYYIWDTAQSQRNRFRAQLKGTFIDRKSFPQLPWGTLKNPKYLQTACGSTLLIDGWWKYARKIHYTCDIVMAFVWTLTCRTTGILPFYYPIFFIIMILHRYTRDQERCKRKYGADWDKYCSIVKHVFIPGVI